MIFVVGDVHGEFHLFKRKMNKLIQEGDSAIIQVGDFGLWPRKQNVWHQAVKLVHNVPVIFIDGNHEHFPSIREKKYENWSGLHYAPRGSVLQINGYRVGFLGGGDSVDKAWRTPGKDWFEEERVTLEDVATLVDNVKKWGYIDILVTHSPPTHVLKVALTHPSKVGFPVDEKWVDISAQMVEQAWEELGQPRLVCGHIHKSITLGKVRVLDILEVVAL